VSFEERAKKLVENFRKKSDESAALYNEFLKLLQEIIAGVDLNLQFPVTLYTYSSDKFVFSIRYDGIRLKAEFDVDYFHGPTAIEEAILDFLNKLDDITKDMERRIKKFRSDYEKLKIIVERLKFARKMLGVLK